MKIRLSVAVVLLLIPLAALSSPFSVKFAGVSIEDGKAILAVSFLIPENNHLYADEIEVRLGDGKGLEPVNRPEPILAQDPESKEQTRIYERDVTLTYQLPAVVESSVKVKIRFRGCNDSACFLPDTTNIVVAIPPGVVSSGAVAHLSVTAAVTSAVPLHAQSAGGDWKKMIGGFRVAASFTGFMSAGDFLRFLDSAEKHEMTLQERLAALFKNRGVWTLLALLLIVIGGLGLNLTPCVLPMIPINIAIIGAGVDEKTGSFRARGFLLGAVYGGAMAIVYGVLGLVVVLTTSRVGTLNSSWIFNSAVAVIFLFLGLAMFDVINLDFSRFQSALGTSKLRGGRFVTAFVMGGVAALLAGACVAPVVGAVLLVARDLYVVDSFLALSLPFVLGLGMGLPWPFLGAGLTFLPKPGRWMKWVKYVFGLFIVGMAIYYGHLAYNIRAGQRPVGGAETIELQHVESGWLQSMSEGLTLAQLEKKPVFVDFWATWCKNCVAMNKITFKNEQVMERLKAYVAVRQQAEDMEDPATKEMLDYFKSIGLPTYIVLVPDTK